MDLSFPFKVQYASIDFEDKICQGCKKLFRRSNLILGKFCQSHIVDENNAIWFHAECFFKHQSADPSEIENLENIRYEDQVEIIAKNQENDENLEVGNVAKKIKTNEEENDEKSRKLAKNKENQIIEMKIKDQTAKFFLVRQLLQKCDISDLHFFLIMNDCEVAEKTEDGLLDHCADVLTFGLIKKCRKCLNGEMKFSKFGYVCNGWISERIRCGNFEEKPERMTWEIPDDLRSNQAFKLIENQVMDRELRQYTKKSCNFKVFEGKFCPYLPNFVNLQIKNEFVIDPEFDLRFVTQVFRNENNIAYDSLLILVDIEKKYNFFYKIQLLEHDDLKYSISLTKLKLPRFFLFTNYGRIGSESGKTSLQNFETIEQATAEFERKFKEMSGNGWDLQPSFVKHPEKYFPIELDYKMNTKFETKYKEKLHNLIKLLFLSDKSKSQLTIDDFQLDLQMMPVGKLSNQQIQAGYQTLSELEKEIKRNSSLNVLTGLSNKFFTMIPHNSPIILDTIQKIAEKKNFIQILINVEKIYSKEIEYKFLNSRYKQLNSDIYRLSESSADYKMIETYIKNTSLHGNVITILEVFKINRHGEEQRFEPYKNSENRFLLWHGSILTNFASIIQNGLKIKNRVHGDMFGRGIYFADVASKSAQYCYVQKFNNIGILVLCEVALGNIYESIASTKSANFPLNYDSVKGIGGVQPDPQNILILDDGVKVPMGKPINLTGVIPGLKLNFNEYIVYTEDKIKIKFIVIFEFLTAET